MTIVRQFIPCLLLSLIVLGTVDTCFAQYDPPRTSRYRFVDTPRKSATKSKRTPPVVDEKYGQQSVIQPSQSENIRVAQATTQQIIPIRPVTDTFSSLEDAERPQFLPTSEQPEMVPINSSPMPYATTPAPAIRPRAKNEVEVDYWTQKQWAYQEYEASLGAQLLGGAVPVVPADQYQVFPANAAYGIDTSIARNACNCCDEWAGYCRMKDLDNDGCGCGGLKANPGHWGLPWLRGCDNCETGCGPKGKGLQARCGPSLHRRSWENWENRLDRYYSKRKCSTCDRGLGEGSACEGNCGDDTCGCESGGCESGGCKAKRAGKRCGCSRCAKKRSATSQPCGCDTCETQQPTTQDTSVASIVVREDSVEEVRINNAVKNVQRRPSSSGPAARQASQQPNQREYGGLLDYMRR